MSYSVYSKFDKYQISEFDNNLKIISEYIPHFRSISLGLWFGIGSRGEHPKKNGITHLIEHLLFKGTKKRSYRDIAIAFDSMGAEFNAFTDKENTCIYADFLDTHLDRCLELLFDVALNPSFLSENIETEKKIILEEIKMAEDNPSEYIFNYFYKTVLDGHPLSLPVLGTRKTVMDLTASDIYEYFTKNFTYSNMVIAAAGNVKHDVLVDCIKKNIIELNNIKPEKSKELTKTNIPIVKRVKKVYKRKFKTSHICYGGMGCDRKNADRYPLSLFTVILGGSMSSRLFQKIREEKGLSYSIVSNNIHYTDAGLIFTYAACSPKNVYCVVDIVDNEIENIRKTGIKVFELERAKENVKGTIVLGIEDVSSRMFRLGKGLLIDGKVLAVDEIFKKIDKINLSDIDRVVQQYFNKEEMSLVIMGRLKKEK